MQTEIFGVNMVERNSSEKYTYYLSEFKCIRREREREREKYKEI